MGYSPWGRKESDTTEQLHWFTGSHKGLSTVPGLEVGPQRAKSLLVA